VGAVTELQRHRETAGLTAAELAQRSGVPEPIIDAAEVLGQPPGLYAQGRLAAALGAVHHELFPRPYGGAAREAALTDG
jgi:predicted transcriptional regulator